MGNNINISFFIRCLFEEKALKTVFSACIVTILIFSYIIRVFEFENPYNDFSNFYNAIWFSVVTMVTVGYGDYTPISIYGRIFSFILGVVGIIVTYLITVILTEKFFLKNNEEIALSKFLNRENEEKLVKKTSHIFYNLIKIRKYMKVKNTFLREIMWRKHLQLLYKNFREY